MMMHEHISQHQKKIGDIQLCAYHSREDVAEDSRQVKLLRKVIRDNRASRTWASAHNGCEYANLIMWEAMLSNS